MLVIQTKSQFSFPTSIQCIVFRFIHVYGLLKESKRNYDTKVMFVKLEDVWQKQHIQKGFE